MNFQDLEKVPSPPGVAVKLLELFASPEISIDDLNNVIGVDPTLTAKIVKYVNSPTFGRKREAQSLRQAITMLGANGVKMIALSFSLTETGASRGSAKFKFDHFWSSSLATAVCARSIFRATSGDAEIGFLVGLLLNIGQLAMYCSNPDKYESLLENRSATDLNLIDIEAKGYGENRYFLGSDVLAAWHFPDSAVNALAKFAQLEHSSTESKSLDLAIRMSHLFLCENPDYDVVRAVNEDLARLTGCDPEATDELFSKTMNEYAQIVSILAYDCPPQKTLKEIELEAKTRIVEMTMDLHMANAQFTQENSELKDMAYVDALTGLGNRRQYESIAEAELARCSRMERTFCLIVIDIDHFKAVNDTWGHAAGDSILAGVAKRLEAGLRNYDFVFRYGGEEFVLVLPESHADDCRVVADRLRQSIEEEPFEFEDQKISVTISLGGAFFDGRKKSTGLQDLFQRGDEALYVAKQSGRNRFVFENDTVPIAVLPALHVDSPSASPQLP